MIKKLAFVFLILYACTQKPREPQRVDNIFGIDVSNHQGKIDWDEVRAKHGEKLLFVYVKASEGSTHRDKRYDYNLKEASRNKYLVGSYHYFRTTSEPHDQFKNFIGIVNRDAQNLIPVVDVEEMEKWSADEFHRKFKDFLWLLEDHFGVKPMIYTVNSFYNRHLAGQYKDYRFFIGRYGKHSPMMKDHHNWTIWQFSESGNVAGIPKPVDLNSLNSNVEVSDLKIRN